jgi:hypothetical protein
MDRRRVHQVPPPSAASTSSTPATGHGEPELLCAVAASAPAGAAGSVCSGTATPAAVPLGDAAVGVGAGGVGVVVSAGTTEWLGVAARVGAAPTVALTGVGRCVGVGVGSATSAAHSVLG